MKRLGLFDTSTLLHPIRLSKNNKKFGISLVSKVVELKEKLHLDEIVLVMDFGKSSYRLGIYPEYKGKRGLKELTPQEQIRLDLMRTWTENLDKFPFLWKVVKIWQVEADDILGMLYNSLKDEYDVTVLTTDKDLQVRLPHLNLYNLGKDRYFNHEDRKGLTMSQFAIYQTAHGDEIDNIKSYIGEKSATILAKNFKNFNEMREFKGNVVNIKGVTPHNKRYIEKFLQDIQTEEVWKGLQLNYKLINIFKDDSNLDELQKDKYKRVLKYIKEDKSYDFDITDELEEFLETVNEVELLNVLEGLF